MTTTFTASEIITQNGYTVTTDFTAENIEPIVDDAVNYINLLTDTSTPHMSGTAGTKTLSISDKVAAALKPLLACMLRETKKSQLSSASSTNASSGGTKSVSVGGVSVSESSSISSAISAASSINNPANTIYREMFLAAIDKIREGEYDWNRAII